MQPKFYGIAFILWARDVLRTEQFYTSHLGIQFTRNTGEDGSVWLLAKIGEEVEMLVFQGDPKPGNTPGIVFGLAEGGIETIVASLAAAGVEIVTPVSEAPGGWSADFKDLDGHVMSFFQDQALPKNLGEKRVMERENAVPPDDVDDVDAVAYFLVLLQPGPNYGSEPDHRAAHISFIETMEAADVVLLGGWFDSPVEGANAAYLLHVASQADAEGWAAKDPFIAHEVFRSHVVAWNLVGISKSAIDPAFGR